MLYKGGKIIFFNYFVPTFITSTLSKTVGKFCNKL